MVAQRHKGFRKESLTPSGHAYRIGRKYHDLVTRLTVQRLNTSLDHTGDALQFGIRHTGRDIHEKYVVFTGPGGHSIGSAQSNNHGTNRKACQEEEEKFPASRWWHAAPIEYANQQQGRHEQNE
jgi:hypothetical protein